MPSIHAVESANRYHPHLQLPSYVGAHRGRVLASTNFVEYADSAWDDSSKKTDLFGPADFNLKDSVASKSLLSTDIGGAAYRPALATTLAINGGLPNYDLVDLKFDVESTIRTTGTILSYHDQYSPASFCYSEQECKTSKVKKILDQVKIRWGIDLPIMHVASLTLFDLNLQKSSTTLFPVENSEIQNREDVEKLRLQIFKDSGISGNVWEKTGLGDIDVYVGLQRHFDRRLRFKTIDISWIFGGIFSTGQKRDTTIVTSVPFGSEKHRVYSDLHIDLGLNYSWHAGIDMGIVLPATVCKNERIPAYKEHPMFSPLLIRTYHSQAMTVKVAPFVRYKNFFEGVHATMSYIYISHDKDLIMDARTDKTVASLLTRQESGLVDNHELAKAKKEFEESIAWKNQSLRLSFTYDPEYKCAKKWYDPVVSFAFDTPRGGRNSLRSRRFSLSASLIF